MDAPARRPMPQPSLASQEFWRSGADGVLRICRCADCGALTHPPLPRCRVCRSEAIQLAPVSGRAVVVGFSINHHQWHPALEVPYVVAIVALEEDGGARLTTNVVNCAPEEVHVGMPVRVAFVAATEDVHLPMFEPDPGRGAAPDDLVEPPSPPMEAPGTRTSRKFEDDVVLSGTGQSKVGRRLMVDPLSLTVEACLAAVEDAGLSLEDIDGVSTFPGLSSVQTGGGSAEGGVIALTEALQLKPTWVNGASDAAGQLGSVISAMMAVSSGLCRHVLCFRTVWQSSHAHLVRTGQWRDPAGPFMGMMEFRAPFGAMSAANWIGCLASNYQHRYGVGRDALGWIAVNARANAARNPEAVYRDPITIDDYFDARMIATPFGLYDCDVPVDGAVAFVVSAAETAGDLRIRPVRVEAVGTQVRERLSWDQSTLTHAPQTQGPARHLWTRTDLTPDDVDVAELYDGFSFLALSWLEGLAFCKPGEATDFIDGGRGIALDGTLPLNTHGGQLSAGRLHGYGFLREAMLQLRGEADGRQVSKARVAAVSAGAGVPSGALLLRTD